MESIISLKSIASSLVFSIIGMGVYWVGFRLFDRLTPYHLWKEIIEEKNTALAVVVGGVSLGIALIISSAIRG